jgi:hypothetical protein
LTGTSESRPASYGCRKLSTGPLSFIGLGFRSERANPDAPRAEHFSVDRIAVTLRQNRLEKTRLESRANREYF